MNLYINFCVNFNLILYLLIIVELCSAQYYNDSTNVFNVFNESSWVPRVVNGRPAQLGDVPYQISFRSLISRHRRLYATFCGGVIIKTNKIVSAAHCFETRKFCNFGPLIRVTGKEIARTYAVAGTLNNQDVYGRDAAGQWRRLKVVVYPFNYKFPRNDICVAVTKQPFVFNNYVAAIPIASRHMEYSGSCLLSGYGQVTPAFAKRKVSSRILQLADLPIISISLCSRRHRKNMRRFVCTSDEVSDASKGDSGGPLVCTNTGDPNEGSKGILVGIVSGNRRYAGSFFTRVSSYYKFVEKNRANRAFVLSYFHAVTIMYYEFYLFCLRFISFFYWR